MDFLKTLTPKSRPASYVSTLFTMENEGDARLNNQPMQTLGGGVQQRPRPKTVLSIYLRPWFVGTLIGAMFFFAIAVEILAYESQRSHGWRAFGLVDFGGLNFLKSAVPVVLMMPFTAMFNNVDQALAGMHAYIVLAQGRAPAEKSLLVSYRASRTTVILRALQNAHFLVLFSSCICIATTALGPLASGILTSRGTGVLIPNVSVQSTKSLGVIPDFANLETFLGAAGYASAAAVQNLTDPPFVHGIWAVAAFDVPPPTGPGTNGTIIVPTTGIRTTSGCGAPASASATLNGNQWTIAGSWQTCSVSFTVPVASNDQYGVQAVSGCTGGQQQQTQADLLPVLFWFLPGGTAQNEVGLTFCQPTAEAFNVLASADLATGLVGNVVVVDQNVGSNNFSGAPQNGQAFNGVVFNVQGADSLTQARSIAIQTVLPDAIYRATKNFPGGLAAIISQNNGAALLNQTNTTYTQFLSIAAQQTYFFDQVGTINAALVNWEIRLWVFPDAAHAYAAVLLLIAFLAIAVHITHAKARRDVTLSADPSTMAATLSMTSGASFPKLLHAGDTEDTMAKSLKGLTFGISRRTWQVTADGEEESIYYGGSRRSSAVPDTARSLGSDSKDQYVFGGGMPYGLPGAADSRASFDTVGPLTGQSSAKPVDPWADTSR